MAELEAVTFDFWGTLFEWNGWAAEVRRQSVRDFVAEHRAGLSIEVVDATHFLVCEESRGRCSS